MAYEDTIRVADLKIRSSRFARVREEAQIKDGQILEIAEFFHPRTQEIADTLPAALGRWLLRSRWARGLVDRVTRKGKVVKTTSIGGFLLLYAAPPLAALRHGTGHAGELAQPGGGDRARGLSARAANRAHAKPGQGLWRDP
jgi:indolepyruvate ferredoxin oxidoreductase, beta subunit